MVGKTCLEVIYRKVIWREIPPSESLFQPKEGGDNFCNSTFSRSLRPNEHGNFTKRKKLILHEPLANGPKVLDPNTFHAIIIWSKKHLHKPSGSNRSTMRKNTFFSENLHFALS